MSQQEQLTAVEVFVVVAGAASAAISSCNSQIAAAARLTIVFVAGAAVAAVQAFVFVAAVET